MRVALLIACLTPLLLATPADAGRHRRCRTVVHVKVKVNHDYCHHGPCRGHHGHYGHGIRIRAPFVNVQIGHGHHGHHKPYCHGGHCYTKPHHGHYAPPVAPVPEPAPKPMPRPGK